MHDAQQREGDPTTPVPQWMEARAREIRSRVVVGLDPDLGKFPRRLQEHARGAASRPEALTEAVFDFNAAIVEATAARAVAFKPQIAFYEQYGLPGLAALRRTLGLIRERGIPVILDAKRNDIDNTATAYARAWLAERDFLGEPNAFRADSLTVNPYMGSDSVRPFLAASQASVFLLAKTSNPGSGELQDLRTANGGTVAEAVARMADKLGEEFAVDGRYSRVGLVVGATYPEDAARLRRLAPRAIFLMPGVGAQKGPLRSIANASDAEGGGALASTSRGVMYANQEAWAGVQAWEGEVRSSARAALEKLVEDINRELGR